MDRKQLKTIIVNIITQVKEGISTLAELQMQLNIFRENENVLEDNKDFEYETVETKQYLVELPRGHYVTNCLKCNMTCHENCTIADDQLPRCPAMSNSYCKVCKCLCSNHKNTPYVIKYTTETVKKNLTDMKKKYEKAIKFKGTHEKHIEELKDKVHIISEIVHLMYADLARCKNRLNEVELRPDPLSEVEHINLMIKAEETGIEDV